MDSSAVRRTSIRLVPEKGAPRPGRAGGTQVPVTAGEALGRSRGGLSTKIHPARTALGAPGPCGEFSGGAVMVRSGTWVARVAVVTASERLFCVPRLANAYQ